MGSGAAGEGPQATRRVAGPGLSRGPVGAASGRLPKLCNPMRPHLLALLLAALALPAAAQPYAGLEASATRLSDPKWRGRGVGLIAGWVVNDHTAVELGWRKLGRDLVVNQPTDGSLWELSAIGRIALSGDMNAYVRGGLSQVRGELADAAPKAGRVRPLLGVGLHTRMADNWALRAEVQRVGSGLVGLRLGVVRRF